MKTAILVDGGFYRYRAQKCLGNVSPRDRASELMAYCWKHLTWRDEPKCDLYRIFYYDCPPLSTQVYHPFLKKTIDLGNSDTFLWANDFYEELRKKRKVALRMGEISEISAKYVLKDSVQKKLFRGDIKIDDVSENDFMFKAEQKGVDMKIGLDIASLSYKKQVDQIVLISGDSDFVSASKLARREGIDFVLDPLYAPIKPSLTEHIDGLRTCDTRFNFHRENEKTIIEKCT